MDSQSIEDVFEDDIAFDVDGEELILDDQCEVESWKSDNGKTGKNSNAPVPAKTRPKIFSRKRTEN